MNAFEFETDDESAAYCNEIAQKMVELFGITLEEAIGRMNRDWHGQKLVGPIDVIYLEDETYWAKTLYFGKDSGWWLNPPNLKPRPY